MEWFPLIQTQPPDVSLIEPRPLSRTIQYLLAANLVPGYPGNEITYAIVGDLLLLVSLFVLGGDFWDKLRALFIGGAKAVFPKTTG